MTLIRVPTLSYVPDTRNIMKRHSYPAFANRVIRENQYLHDENMRDFLEFVASSFSGRVLTLPKGCHLWRAQLDCDTQTEEHDGESYGEIPVPWTPARMIPDASKVREGRTNPRGIAYLYLSTSKETAMHEVRPWTGSVLSTAIFKVVKDLKLVDFSKFYGKAHSPSLILSLLQEPTEEEIQESVWIRIDNAFSKPIPNNEDPTKYIPTQVIAELVKSKGYDGIAYKSVFSDGFNIVLFDLKAASLIYCSIYYAIEVKMSFGEEEGPYGKYWVNYENT